jgi:hypothetical protein
MVENPFMSNINIPEKVFKFRDWVNPYHKKLLEGEIYLSSPLDFNDPFDCNIQIAYDNLQNNPQMQLEYFTSYVNRSKPLLKPKQKLIEVQRLIAEGRYNDNEWIQQHEQKTRLMYGNIYGVYCLSKTKQNILLWSHYANSHKGFCVGFNPKQFFFECLNSEMGGRDVVYSSDYPVIDPRENVLQQLYRTIYTKSIDWKYEEEYRLRKINAARQSIQVSMDCINEINLGCEMPDEHKKEILDFVAYKLPNVKIFQAKILRKKFEITFEQIK